MALRPTHGVVYSLKGVIDCEYEQGGSTQRDQNGTEFVPMSTFYPVSSAVEIKRGDKVVLGDTSGETSPVGTEEVLKVSSASASYFGWPDERVVYTG